MEKIRYILLLVLATTGYGLMPIFTQIAYNAGFGPIELVFVRFLGATLVLLAFHWLRNSFSILKLPLKTIVMLIFLIGVLFTLTILAKFLAFQTMPMGVVQAIFYGYPLVVIVITIGTGKEQFSFSLLIGYVIIFVGILLTLDLSDARITVLGILFSMASMFLYPLYIINIKHKRILPVPSLTITTYVMITGSVVMLFPFLFTESNIFGSVDPSGWWGVAGLVFVSSIGAFFIFNFAAKQVKSSTAAIICSSEPVMTIIFESIIFGSFYSLQQYAGIILIPVGIIISLTLNKKAKAPVPVKDQIE
jgi:drug/metabolite transporter (DMT)-like permease